MVIVQHYPHSAKRYAEATPFPGHLLALPDRCPHPECQATDAVQPPVAIRWGTYERWACTRDEDYLIRVQRVRYKVCGRTHSLLPTSCTPADTMRSPCCNTSSPSTSSLDWALMT